MISSRLQVPALHPARYPPPPTEEMCRGERMKVEDSGRDPVTVGAGR